MDREEVSAPSKSKVREKRMATLSCAAGGTAPDAVPPAAQDGVGKSRKTNEKEKRSGIQEDVVFVGEDFDEANAERDESEHLWVLEDACRTENCVSWSADGTLAIVAGSMVSLIDTEQHGALGAIALKRGDKSPLSAFGINNYSESYSDSQLLSDLCVRWAPYFTCAGWSPAGLALKGGCLLLVASSDGQTTIHEADPTGAPDCWANSCLSLSLSQPLFNLCEAPCFDRAIPQLDGAESVSDTESEEEKRGSASQSAGAGAGGAASSAARSESMGESIGRKRAVEGHICANSKGSGANSGVDLVNNDLESMAVKSGECAAIELERAIPPPARGAKLGRGGVGRGRGRGGGKGKGQGAHDVGAEKARVHSSDDGHGKQGSNQDDGLDLATGNVEMQDMSSPMPVSRGRGRGRGGKAGVGGRARKGGEECEAVKAGIAGEAAEAHIQVCEEVVGEVNGIDGSCSTQCSTTACNTPSKQEIQGAKELTASSKRAKSKVAEGVGESGNGKEASESVPVSSSTGGGSERQAAKDRLVQAFLACFYAARAAVSEIQVVEYAKGQRLTEQDAGLVEQAATSVLQQQWGDAEQCGLDAGAVRKMLQVELRVHWNKKNLKSSVQALSGTSKTGGQAVSGKHCIKKNSKVQSCVGGLGEERGEMGDEVQEAEHTNSEHATLPAPGARKRRCKAQVVYVEENSDQDFRQDDDADEGDEDEAGLEGRGGGGVKKMGHAAKMKTTTQDVKPKRKRSNHKIDGVVGYDTGRSMSETKAPSRACAGGGGGDDGGHVMSREEASRIREWVVVKCAVWRPSLLLPHLLGLAPDESGSKTSERPSLLRRPSVGLVASMSSKLVSIWAISRSSALGAPAGQVGGGGRSMGQDGMRTSGIGCALVATVRCDMLQHGLTKESFLCLDWVMGSSFVSFATAYRNGAVDILVFKRHEEGAGRKGSMRDTLGFMNVALHVCPPGGMMTRHIACCSSRHTHPLSCNKVVESGEAEAGGGGAAEIAASSVLVMASARGIWFWRSSSGLVRAEQGGDVACGHITCLSVDGSGEHVASMCSDGTVFLWRVEEGGEVGRGGLVLLSRFKSEPLSGSNTMTGGALSYHGCFVAIAGRRVMPQRGRQSLTFPTGLEGIVTLQRVPGVLASAESRSTLFSRASTHMHAQVHAVELGYGGREPAGSIKWWWDLSHLAAKEMDASEGERVIEILRLHALKASAATSALATSKQATSSEKEKGGRDEVLGVARGARQGASQEAEAGPRQPLHACVRQSDEFSSRLLLALAAQVDARDPKASTPLMIAAVAGHAGIVKVLLSHGACLDAEDRDGLTALHWSTAMGHLAVVEALVKAGAKVGADKHDSRGHVTVDELALSASPEIQALLRLALP